ncbi:PP2C family protein-serine/threonine phosphatase [Amycolatopsis sp. CA-126428]|uniref:PP2C family protein-serine/threonine phosphatase n=1 Tax=Amycolatopsis sp. CA-126428 TaxID=2073158 RepID=UPI000CD085F3|nr:protein phosphatase 2C domain-containing protein [Amycolatopsis sp. CA-126428]
MAPGDKFCERCGLAQPAGRDRIELNVGDAAGISDRGRHHYRNEDALAIRAGERLIAVVCDGVSTSDRPDEAARLAADTAADVLSGGGSTKDAVGAAAEAVAALAPGTVEPPACTYVSAVLTGDEVRIGWVGDSRAYWLGETECRLLTEDDAVGHVLTAWLGADAGEVAPRELTLTPAEPGTVLLCSDGLWNYLGEARELRDHLRTAPSPAAAAAGLVRYANDQGGHDNITVVLLPFPPATTRSAS